MLVGRNENYNGPKRFWSIIGAIIKHLKKRGRYLNHHKVVYIIYLFFGRNGYKSFADKARFKRYSIEPFGVLLKNDEGLKKYHRQRAIYKENLRVYIRDYRRKEQNYNPKHFTHRRRKKYKKKL